MSKIHDPAAVKAAQERRAAQAAQERLQRAELKRRQRAEIAKQEQQRQRGKDETAHYFQKEDGKRQLRSKVRGKDTTGRDGTIKAGYNAESQGDVAKNQKLKAAQKAQQDHQRRLQQANRAQREKAEAAKHTGKAKEHFGRAEKGR